MFENRAVYIINRYEQKIILNKTSLVLKLVTKLNTR